MRPCPFSTVSTRATSGAGAHSAEGGIRPEGQGDIGFQRRLVALDREEVIAAALDDEATEVGLGEDRIAADDRTLDGKRLEQGRSVLSKVRAAVISLASGATRNCPMTPCSRSLNAASRCTPGASPTALPRSRLPSIATCPAAPAPFTQVPRSRSSAPTSSARKSSLHTEGAGTRPRNIPSSAKAWRLSLRPQRTIPS